ncbi:MAG: DNA polymerase III subunit delta [Bacilli bacterium]|nr:DNA polymerase III subunit delta [Bacilli bacterium]
MIYFIYGNQSPTIKSQIKKITKAFLEGMTIDEFNYVKLDGNNILVQDAVDECRYVSLGYDKKVVSLENCYFLLKPKPKNKIDADQDYQVLKDYISSENGEEEVTFILSVPSDSIDEKGEIVSLLKEKTKVIEIADPDEKSFLEYIAAYTKKYNIVIDKDALRELAARTDGDVALFKNSIEKLTLYTDHIRYQDVVKMVTRKLDDNAFLIQNYLVEGRNTDAINLFRDLRVSNVEPVTLIGQLANQFRMINQIRYLLRVKKMTADEAAKELKIKPGRVFAISKSLSLISEKAVNRTLDDLFNLDLEIKSGRVDRFYAFELFLLKFKRN